MVVLIVFGTRPEAIKMAPLVKFFNKDKKVTTKVAVTAQHREMLDQVLTIFDIVPDYDLDLMTPGQGLSSLTSKCLNGITHVIQSCNPDIVLVHGDTTTSMASALAAFYTSTKIAHVEAGLRTYDLQSPWPEEANRQIISKLANFHFAPTNKNKEALKNEEIIDNVYVTGNTVIDSLLDINKKISNTHYQKNIKIHLENAGLNIKVIKSRFVLITGHRRENFGDGFESICNALSLLASDFRDIHFIYPVHLNPKVQEPVNRILSKNKNIHLINPLNYTSFIFLMSKCEIVLTDSGGIQEEAPTFGKPVLVMRNTTERVEAIDAGTALLVGSNSKSIYNNVKLLLTDQSFARKMSEAINPYGDGKASERIYKAIIDDL